jgi:hypothetical protein
LRVGSVAIDGGDATACPPTDQRGRAREGTCDIGAFEATHGPCGDGFVDLGEACDAETDDACCLPTCQAADAETPCADDGDLCTRDTCDAMLGTGTHTAAPAPVCRGAARSQLALRAAGSLAWSWLHGAATAAGQLGDPRSGSGSPYALCVYAGEPLDELFSLVVPASAERWGKTATGSLHYKEAGDGTGVRKLLVRPGGAGRARAQVVGMVAPLIGDVAAPIVVQLHNDGQGGCWESRFEGDEVRRLDAGGLRATAVR